MEPDEGVLNRAGERIFTLQRSVLLREGWRDGEADVPAECNFARHLETGNGPGKEDRQMIREMADTVVQAMESVLAPPPEAQGQAPCLPKFLEKKCTGCGLCAKACVGEVLLMRGKKAAIVNPDRCCLCGHCVSVCPADAVKDSLATRKETPLIDPAVLPSEKSLHMFFRSRRSVRFYKDKPVSRKDLEKILEAGTYAPTAGNRQDVEYLVLADANEIRELRELVFPFVYKMFSLFNNRAIKPILSAAIGRENVDALKDYLPLLDRFQERYVTQGDDRIFFSAPTLVIVHGSKYDDTVGLSCAVCLYQASLMAQAMNVGTCYNGFLQVAINKNKKVRQALGIPARNKCYGALTMGYPKMKYRRAVRRNPPKVTWR